MHWIIGIFMGFMALLGHQTVITTVPISIPVTIESPKGVVTEGRVIQLAQTESVARTTALTATTSLPLINPNPQFMEVRQEVKVVDPVVETPIKTVAEEAPYGTEPSNSDQNQSGQYQVRKTINKYGVEVDSSY